MIASIAQKWTGTITSGDLKGYCVEVRLQRFPWPLYTLALSSADLHQDPEVTFAFGRSKLAEHFRSLALNVTWDDGRGPLAPERDRLHPRSANRTSADLRHPLSDPRLSGIKRQGDTQRRLSAQARRSSLR